MGEDESPDFGDGESVDPAPGKPDTTTGPNLPDSDDDDAGDDDEEPESDTDE